MQVQEAGPETPTRPPGPLKTALKPPKRRLRQSSGDSSGKEVGASEGQSPINSPREPPGNVLAIPDTI